MDSKEQEGARFNITLKKSSRFSQYDITAWETLILKQLWKVVWTDSRKTEAGFYETDKRFCVLLPGLINTLTKDSTCVLFFVVLTIFLLVKIKLYPPL